MRWWKRLLQTGRLEDAIDKELRFHFDTQVAEYVREGLTEADARRRARLEFGGLDQIKEACRDERGTQWVDAIHKDIALTLRGFRRSPGFAAGAIGTLALGLGATIAIFGVLYAAVLKPLPYADPDALVTISASIPQMRARFPSLPLRAVDVLELQRAAPFLSGAAALAPADANLTGAGEPERVHGARVSANLFSLLGVDAAIGRTFTTDEDQPGSARVVVISHELWTRHYGADPALVNRTIDLDGVAHTVVGILPGDVLVPTGKQLHPLLSFGSRIDFWRPLALTAEEISSEGSWDYGVIARFAPGVSIDQGRAQMEPLRQRIEARVREQAPNLDFTLNFDFAPLAEIYSRHLRRELLLLFAAVGVLLLIACANLANLLLARSTSRRREFATRAALGASRLRLVSLVVTESMVIAALGAVGGLLLAGWGTNLLLAVAPVDLGMRQPIGVETAVVLFGLGAMLVSMVLTGALPAAQAGSANLHEEVKNGARTATAGRRAMAGRRTLIAGEVAMATALVVVTGLLLHSFANLLRVDRGFTNDEVLAVDLSLSPHRYPAIRAAAFYRELVERVRALPGVRSAGAVSVPPLVHESNTRMVRYESDDDYRADLERPIAIFRTIEGEYFGSLGVPLVAGRFFRPGEREPVGIISNGLARRLWPDEPAAAAIGRRVRQGDLDTPLVTVVGVVGDVHTGALDREPMPAIYRPQTQAASIVMTLVVRTAVSANTLAPNIRALIHGLDAALPVGATHTLNDIADASVRPRRFQLLLIALFAAMALVLAIIGVWGVTSYSVAMQRHDLGVRMALGAARRELLAGIVKQALLPVAVGLVAGLVIAGAAGTLMRELLYDIQPLDPVSFAVTGLLLLVTASIGCYLPARRAANLDPLEVLRSE
jgi:predicted permease